MSLLVSHCDHSDEKLAYKYSTQFSKEDKKSSPSDLMRIMNSKLLNQF